MIRITTTADLLKIEDSTILPYIEELLQEYLTTYSTFCPDRSIEPIGIIYLLENDKELTQYQRFGLYKAITLSSFEWLDDLGNEYTVGCIVLDNDRAINIIGKQDYFHF